LEGERGALSLPESGNLTTAARKEKKGENEAHPHYMRVPHERRAKSTSNPLTEVNRRKNSRDLSRHAADLRHRENARFLKVRGPASRNVLSKEIFRLSKKAQFSRSLRNRIFMNHVGF